MKKLIILLIVIHSSTVFCQDYEPSQVQFNWGVGGSLKYLSGDSMYFKQDKMIIGWHWGASRRISEAVYANQNDATRNIDESELAESCKVFMKPIECSHAVGPEVMNARAIQYEPTIIIDTTDYFTPRMGDNSCSVFGFNYRNFNVGDTNSTGNDYGRFTLNADAQVTFPVKVFSNIWMGDAFRWLDYDGDDHGFGWNIGRTNDSLQYLNTERDKAIYHPVNGKKWYLTVNLRRKNINDDDTLDNAIVLEIKLPYRTTEPTYRSIRFDSLPSRSFFTHRM